ncbi:UDP-galactopyranose mutase [Actinomycetia phage DSL-LC01]|nr:UDP-galactopyranose mutase [Actinomycetia phage DSL-LC01]
MRKALIVGSGLTGVTAGIHLKNTGEWNVEIHEAFRIAGGAVRTESIGGILYEPNGTHISHTENERVVEVLKKYSEWVPYVHIVKTVVNGRTLSWPPQVSELQELEEWPQIKLELDRLPSEPDKTNFETYAISIMGETLYRWFIYPYTAKQWGTDPSNLSSSFAPKRIDLRTDGYRPLFRDSWQGWPRGGWTQLMMNMLADAADEVWLNKKDSIDTIDWGAWDAVIVTAPLDEFLHAEPLAWRGVSLQHRYIPGQEGYALAAGVVNQPGLEVPYTRIIETKQMSDQADLVGTVLSYEYPGAPVKHYPVADAEGVNKARANELKRQLVEAFPHAVTAGRLANYVYIDTDQAILQGIVAAEKVLKNND